MSRSEVEVEQKQVVNSNIVNPNNNSNVNSVNNVRGVSKSKNSIADRIQQSPVNVSGVTRVRELLSNVGATVAKGSNYNSNNDQD